MTNKKFISSGYSVVEMILYISIFAVVSVVAITTIVSFTRSYRELSALRAIDEVSISAMERMTREIRQASSVDSANSVLNTSPGVLSLVTSSGAVSTTTKFYMDSSTLKVDINGTYYGPLIKSGVTLTSLIFRQLTGPNSTAVKIDMTVQSQTQSGTKSKTFHSTIVLKGK